MDFAERRRLVSKRRMISDLALLIPQILKWDLPLLVVDLLDQVLREKVDEVASVEIEVLVDGLEFVLRPLTKASA